ncbi:transcriptional regulator [Levilactobacillus brevis]|jgi:transcriptional regulator with XRE-family HTH domain|uniref:Helix-turn-helix transcriptional regulator n=1 Tax=Levilactobacillus brevis TaxID=1580 RepID=A0AB38X6A0_LEVBR|nr:helix-turn-helix transcriptional regulator [Levilactobacillus brevis]DAP36971.1 MAG TPA: repressor protein [Caudoviricetes sp.]ANN49215.1 transcriptional regulator [Levilactobacillus brevis]ATU69051.1 XRE family transcriptional regulator [Levilactobacillus brevis]MCT2886854.1 XRE family transcriptional regulator [Levilactobacillus brevis]MCT3574184.1 XRE family transcriptional regulator [Levilactobacillus brevis]
MDKELISRIIDLRESHNWTQKDLADKMGFNKVTMNKIEHGNRNITNSELAKFADIFEVTTDYLLGKNSTPVWANKKDTNDLEKFLTDNEGSMTYGGEDLTEEEKEQVRVAMTTIFWKRHKHD